MNCEFQVAVLIFPRFPSGLKPHKAPSLPDSGFFSFTNGEISHTGCGQVPLYTPRHKWRLRRRQYDFIFIYSITQQLLLPQ